MRALRIVAVTAAATCALALGGCADSDAPMEPDGPTDNEVRLTVNGLPPIAQSAGVFELWISFALPGAELGGTEGPGPRHAAAASAGRFKINDTSEVVGLDYQPIEFAVDPEDPNVPTSDDGDVLWQLAADAFITIEDAGTDDGAPRLQGLIAGSFVNGTSSLSILHGDALNRDFSAISGSAILATPTTSALDDENKGVWFATPNGAAPSLSLPSAPAGWTYEGWVVIPPNFYRSLGQFTEVDEVDSDGAGPLSMGQQPWNLPGSDFPYQTTGDEAALTEGNIFVTLEPDANEDGDGPFSLFTLLSGPIPSGAPTNESFPLTPVASFPTGTVQIPFNP